MIKDRCRLRRTTASKPGRLATFKALVVLVAALALCTAGVAAASGFGNNSAAHAQYNTASVVTPTTATTTTTQTPAAQQQPAASVGAVHAATSQSGPHRTLPFTGLSLLAVVLVGGGLVVLGFVLRRRGDETPDNQG